MCVCVWEGHGNPSLSPFLPVHPPEKRKTSFLGPRERKTNQSRRKVEKLWCGFSLFGLLQRFTSTLSIMEKVVLHSFLISPFDTKLFAFLVFVRKVVGMRGGKEKAVFGWCLVLLGHEERSGRFIMKINLLSDKQSKLKRSFREVFTDSSLASWCWAIWKRREVEQKRCWRIGEKRFGKMGMVQV